MLGRVLFSNKPVVVPIRPHQGFAVSRPPDDTVSAMEFSPAAIQQNFLIAGSWDKSVRCWEVEQSGNTVPKAMQSMTMKILDVCWSDDGTKVFMVSGDKQMKCWDLERNETVQLAAHDAPIMTCHWVKAPSYTCIMTGSFDRTLKFWDIRSSVPMMTINLPERVYCADVDYPLAVVGTASQGIIVYKLEGKPEMEKSVDSLLEHQHRCVSIFRDKTNQSPAGFGLGSVDGHVAIHYIQPQRSRDNFTLKCHPKNDYGTMHVQDINYAVDDIKFHPVHGTFATVGSDATFAYWDKDVRSKLMSSETFDLPITKCCFSSNGQIFAYSTGYGWTKRNEYNNPAKNPQIFLKPCFEDLKPKSST